MKTTSCAVFTLGVVSVAAVVFLAVAFIVVGTKLHAKVDSLTSAQEGILERVEELEEENDYLFDDKDVSNKASLTVNI